MAGILRDIISGTDAIRFLNNDRTKGFQALLGTGLTLRDKIDSSYIPVTCGYLRAATSTAITAGGAAGQGVAMSTTPDFGIFFGSGAPTISAAKGSLYLRSDGSTTNDRAYINTNGATTWTALITVA